ncbi:putative nucleic acid-binding Zn-ribbon protein [Oikeobacillus pervagus]|uniref:Nucleic acid-binding Zn-ribbon protein n=1 Tax=Oikeobacillus pervagus TaxID=1325931 RepID=A0AAJ1T1G8_9BACI|nr:putative nucleic acid-binding Zn-ribbon protein [Oikeobacillus pervagus]
MEQWREQWAEHANKALEREGIQDRISHLSHEARGLEVLPTIHLGHVAHEMEKRGVESNRGTINRDREEYNRVVVDLQTYREEKRALEQELARQQEQKQQVEPFNTPTKRVPVQEVPNISQVESTLLNMEKQFKQLEEKAKQVKDTDQ